jgi:hypothetical protein
VTATSGCGGTGAGASDPQRYLPSPEAAQKAVVTVLSQWRDAPRPLPETFDTPSVRFVDKQRRPDQALRAFQVLGRRAEPHALQFTVRMTLDPPSDGEADQLVRYNVFGKDPIWVYRLEDYEMISHWEHPMDDDEPAAAAAPGEAVDQPSTRTRRIP